MGDIDAHRAPRLVAPGADGGRPSVLSRATAILDLFHSGSEVCLLEDIAIETGLPRSTAFRLVTQLVDLGWLVRDTRGGYQLGARAHTLGARTRSSTGGHDYAELRGVAARMLNHLHRRTQAAVHLGVLEGGDLYYLDKVGGVEADQLPSRVGTRVPAHQTAMGRALLATLSPERVDALYAHDPPRGPARDLARLHQELATARARNGLVLVHADASPIQVGAVAVAISGLGPTRAAIGVTAPEPFRPELCAPLVLAAARRVGLELQAGRRHTGRPAAPDGPAIKPTISA